MPPTPLLSFLQRTTSASPSARIWTSSGGGAHGEKITAKIGGNLNIETLQEKETYEEDNHTPIEYDLLD